MRKIFTLLAAAALFTAAAKNEVYESKADGTIYTLATLAAIPETGVEKIDDNTYRLTKDINLNEDDATGKADGLRINNNETVRLGASVIVRVYGPMSFAVTDTAQVCPDKAGNKCKGFHIYKMDSDDRTIAHVRFEEASLSLGNPSGTIIENCSFINSNGEIAKYSICFSGACVNSVVRNCYFHNTQFSAIGSGSNVAAGVTVEDNLIEACSLAGRNYPYINLTPSGDNGGTFIRRNTIKGAKGMMAGAISVSNMLGITGANQVEITGNYMDDCRYGMNIYGSMDARITGNKIINCHYETNANNGGSGITFYGKDTHVVSGYVSDNYIDGCLWGVTVVGEARVNLGRTDLPVTDPGYNPGLNVFKNNGNSGVAPEKTETCYDPSIPYDLYNNTTDTIWAQGNTWGGPDQSPEEIEKRIFHKNDNPDLGVVIYLPIEDSGITAISDNDDSILSVTVNSDGSFRVNGTSDSTPVTVYAINGTTLWSGTASATVTIGYRGTAIIRAGTEIFKVIL